MRRRKNIPVFFPPGSPADMNPIDSVFDPLGSYTGQPEDPYEVPVQDADDL